MKRLTEQDIAEINDSKEIDSWYSGIFKEPFGVPNTEKRLLVYSRYESGGVSGGSCWDSSNPQPYTSERPKNHMKILDLVLEKLCPNITYLDYKKISELIVNSEISEYEYYGNSTDWVIEYIPLDELYKHFNL